MTEKKLKINYPKRNRAPKPETQLADEEKKAQKAAQSTPRRRHQLQTFDLVTVDPPQKFPSFENNFELRDPSLPDINPLLNELDFMLADTRFPDIKSPEFTRLLLTMPHFKGLNLNQLNLLTPRFFHQFKLRLYDLYDLVNRFDFGLGEYPIPASELVSTKTEEEYEEWEQHKRYIDFDVSDARIAVSHNGTWTDEYRIHDNIEIVRAGNICAIRIYLTADENSTVGNDYVDSATYWDIFSGEWVEVPIDPGFTGTPAIIYDVSYESQDYEKSFFNSTVRNITHTLRDYEGDTIPYPTNISLSFSNGRLNINESFPYATSATKCNVKRQLKVYIIGDVGKPFYEEFRNED